MEFDQFSELPACFVFVIAVVGKYQVGNAKTGIFAYMLNQHRELLAGVSIFCNVHHRLAPFKKKKKVVS